MWQSAGICRTQEVLEKALTHVISWREEIEQLKIGQYLFNLTPNQTVKFNSDGAENNLRIYAETVNLLEIAYLILQSAAFRKESRGGHYRLDYPETSPDWAGHTLVQGDRLWR
jgi:L-aspartate oxidase